MSGRAYYQYETSPRKLKPQYEPTHTKKKKVTSTKKVKKQINAKQQKKLESKSKKSLFMKSLLMFAILFLIIFRNSQINESFSQIQNLKSEITAIQKQNDQLEISIQNSLNLNNIEQLNDVVNMTDSQIEAWLQLVMLGKVQANKEQLSAADKLLKTRGMYEKNKTIGTNGGAVYKWKSTVEAEIVHEESTQPDKMQ